MFRRAAGLVLLSGVFTFSSCAYILHPERSGRSGGNLDTVPLVVDILWFLPGIIPGVICLVVDFTTGAIYTGGGSAKVRVRDSGDIVVRKPEVQQATHASLRLVDGEGRVIDSDEATWLPGTPKLHERLRVKLDKAAKQARATGAVALSLELQLDDKAPVVYPLEMWNAPA